MNKYFNISDKVFDVTQKYPELIELFANNGFENLKNNMLRKTLGKTISIEMALRSKKIDIDSFEKKMLAVIENKKSEDFSCPGELKKDVDNADIRVMGLLPCPIRMQMIEKLENYLENTDIKVNYELQAASMGLDNLKNNVQNARSEKELADIYMSAGYGFFFDKKHIGKYVDEGVFSDLTNIDKFNSDFQNEYINLKDPKGIYNIIGVVPAIFMVNKELLGDRKMPTSWKDLLSDDFIDDIAIPMSDLDLFNAILLGILVKYGKIAIEKLGRNTKNSLHPAQMLKLGQAHNKNSAPTVQVMPYFFTFVAKENGPLQAVWPEDGAILSPIFFLSKKNVKLKSFVNFLFSEEMGMVLSADGKFPSTNAKINNHLSGKQKFIWPGWDFLHSNDIAEVLAELLDIFLGKKGI